MVPIPIFILNITSIVIEYNQSICYYGYFDKTFVQN